MTKKIKDINFRIIGLYLFVLFIATGVVVKIVKIQQFITPINTSSQPRYFSIEAPRGNIIADDGSLLAISMPLYDVRLDMSVMDSTLFNNNVAGLSILLANLFEDKTPAEYELFLISSKKEKRNKYILLQNKVTHNELNVLKKMPILKLGQNKGGLIAERRPNRENPFGLLAQRTIGVLRSVNPVGIERAFNPTLSGVDGKHLKRKIATGIWVPQDDEGNKLPRAGNNVVTTINTDMQDVAEKALENTLFNHDADWGCVVLMEVKTGEVKVIANLKKQEDGSVIENFNYAMAKHVSPGSTFKLASVIAGLEDGFFKVEDSVQTYGGKFTFYDRVMKDSQLGLYDNITIKTAFIKSSNVGISRIIVGSYKSNPTAFTDRIYKMGLSTPLKLELPFPNNLKSPIPNKGSWSGVTLPWMSIGYEMQLTPIHMLTFYNAIANQGKMIKPIFTSAISRDGKIIEERTTEVINPAICSKATIDVVMPLLIGVVEEGTAQNIKSGDYLIAGKTGTTVINFNNRADGEEKEYQASFVGFFPADNPKYSCIVVVNNPKENGHYGGSVAAPIFKELADKVYASDMSIHKGLQQSDEVESFPTIKQGSIVDVSIVLYEFGLTAPASDNGEWDVFSTGKPEVLLGVKKVEWDLQNGNMPDLRGMGIQDAIYLLEAYGLIVESIGCGAVVLQSIPKGDPFKKGTIIKLELA
jgi:cell division protein FtsI (penicillin-binding protein 3)